jgi:hypothetical protein
MLSIFVSRGKTTAAAAASTQKSANAASMRRLEDFWAFLVRTIAALNLSADSVNFTDAGATRGKGVRPSGGRSDPTLAGSAASLFAILLDAAVPGMEVSRRVVECRISTE